MGIRGILLAMVLFFGTIYLAGCFSSNPADISVFKIPQKTTVTSEQYILQPPDEIEIHCTKAPEINLQRQKIRPDGKVAFEAIGEIQAAGRTPKDVADEIGQKIAKLYSLGDNPVDVQVETFRSAYYYVLGEVFFEGPKVYTGRDTVLYAIAAARPTVMAWVSRIQIVRPSNDPNVKAKIFEVDYDRMIAHGEASKDVLLEEGDIVFVPPTVLAAAGMKVAEFVRPITTAFSTANVVDPSRQY